MGVTLTVSQVQERARLLAELPAFTTNSQVDSATVLEWTKASLRQLAALVKTNGGEQYLVSASTLTTTANVPSVAFAPGNVPYPDLVRLTWQRDSQTEIPLERANVDEMDPYPAKWSQGAAGPIRYRVMGQTIRLFPTPDAVYTLNLYSTGTISVTDVNSTVDFRDLWDDWVVNDLCVRIRVRQQKDASEFLSERSRLEGMIVGTLRRDKYRGQQARDMRTNDGESVSRARWWKL